MSPIVAVKCEEEWTLDTPPTTPAPLREGPDIKCVRHTVVYEAPMNKAGTSTKEDVDITYRKIAIGAGWQLYK